MTIPADVTLTNNGIVYNCGTINRDGIYGSWAGIAPNGCINIAIAAQNGVINSGTAGSATFAVTTAQIPNNRPVTLQWFSNAAGTTSSTTPTGVTAIISNVSNNATTVTMNATTNAQQVTRWFRITIDGVTSDVVQFTVLPRKTVTVSSQNGVINAGIESESNFAVTTDQIADGQEGTVLWYSNSNGQAPTTAPEGIVESLSAVSNNAATVTMTATTAAAAGIYYFRVRIDGVESSVATLTVRNINVAAQNGIINEGFAGSATFSITTIGISNGQQVAFQWFSDADGTIPTTVPEGITPTATNLSNFTATATITATTATTQGEYYFRLTVDGVQSAVATLTVSTSRITLLAQNGTINEGTSSSVIFYITTTNNQNNYRYSRTVQWFSDDAGTLSTNAPSGISASWGSSSFFITVSATEAAREGTYWFRISFDGEHSSVGILTVLPPKTVTVAAQNGTITAGAAGTVTFAITTDFIADGSTGLIRWYSDASGTTSAGTPQGISASVSNVSDNAAIVTVSVTEQAMEKTYWFRISFDGEQSSVGTLTVLPSKTVTVAAQNGTITAGAVGTVTFAITTDFIADGSTGSIRWFSDAAGTTSISAPSGISSSVSSVSENSATVTFTSSTATTVGIYYFRVMIDGVMSDVVTLWILEPAFVAVMDITDVPETAITGVPLTLSSTVVPDNATNQTIVWSVHSAGNTGATISGNILDTKATGSVTVRATINNGATGRNYIKDFEIIVNGMIFVNEKPATIRDNNVFHIIADCGVEQKTVEIAAPENATVEIDGVAGNSRLVALPDYGVTDFEIKVKAQNGDLQTYSLEIERPYDYVFYEFPNVPAINNNPQTNGGYIFTRFRWFRSGIVIPEENKPYLYITDNAVYHAEMTLNNGRTFRTCNIGNTATSTGKLIAYPNPTRGVITITNEQLRITNEEAGIENSLMIQVFDVHGRLVLHTRDNPFDMSGLPEGVYVVDVNGEKVRVVVSR